MGARGLFIADPLSAKLGVPPNGGKPGVVTSWPMLTELLAGECASNVAGFANENFRVVEGSGAA
jgi:hypothetical protein